jgi:hypothetical protein
MLSCQKPENVKYLIILIQMQRQQVELITEPEFEAMQRHQEELTELEFEAKAKSFEACL